MLTTALALTRPPPRCMTCAHAREWREGHGAHSMPRSSQFKISTTTPDGAEHSLRVEDDRVVLGTGDWATPIVVSPDAAGHVTLSLIDHRGLEVDGQRLRLRASAATPFVPEPVSPMANHLYLHPRRPVSDSANTGRTFPARRPTRAGSHVTGCG